MAHNFTITRASQVYMPYYNPDTQVIEYDQQFQGRSHNDLASGLSYNVPEINVYPYINQQNPDWRRLGIEADIIGPYYVEHYAEFTPEPRLIAISIQIISDTPDRERWYMPTDIAKYGALRYMYGAQYGELHFINSRQSIYDCTETSLPNGVSVILKPNVHAIMFMLPKVAMPQVKYGTTTPAVTYTYPSGVI